MKALDGVSDFESSVLGGEGLVVVDFGAPWCPPCRQLAPVLDAACARAGVEVFKVNTDEVPELARRYEVRALPTVVGFVGGEVVAQWVGAASQARLDKWLGELQREAGER